MLTGVRTRPSNVEELRDHQVWPVERFDEKSLAFSFEHRGEQNVSEVRPTGKSSFDFGVHSTPVVIMFDETKDIIDTCLAVSKPWCFCDVIRGTLKRC